jgi:hypothetical protein
MTNIGMANADVKAVREGTVAAGTVAVGMGVGSAANMVADMVAGVMEVEEGGKPHHSSDKKQT